MEASGSFTGSFTGVETASFVESASHALQADNAQSASHALQADTADGGTGSFTGIFDGTAELTGTLTGSVTGAVAVLSSGSGKLWARSTGSDAGGSFNALDFTLGELGSRFGALVDELLVFIPLPEGPPALPQGANITLFYDVREQGDDTIIDDTSSNNKDQYRVASASFTYRTSPPSVDLEAGVDAENVNVETTVMRADADGTSTLMILIKPADNSLSYVTNYSNGHNILLSFVADKFELFIGGSEHTGDDPRVNTQLDATQSVWQTV